MAPSRLTVIFFACLAVASRGDNIAIIGAGYSGLAAALEASWLGHNVTVIDSNPLPGGRAQQLKANGFSFDMGPSWYWMPELYDRIFEKYGHAVRDYYTIQRLEPAYRVYFPDESVDVPGTLPDFFKLVQQHDPGAVTALHSFFDEAKAKYAQGIYKWIWKPHTSFAELLDWELLGSVFKMDMFKSYHEHVAQYTSNAKIQTLLEWPVMFLGLSPQNSPALYSLMAHAAHSAGTFYPSGGMQSPALALMSVAEKMGSQFRFNATVDQFKFTGSSINEVCIRDAAGTTCDPFDGVIATGDYHQIEQHLLPRELRRYSEEHWNEQEMSPLVILYYIGLSVRVPELLHHTFFFDDGLANTQKAVFEEHSLAANPAFYVSATSKTDPNVAPSGGESLFILVPLSYKLRDQDTAGMRRQILSNVLQRMESKLNFNLTESIVYQSNFGPEDFEGRFNAFRGNAFGHANLLSQSLSLKPSMDSLVSNMVFAGHLTHPGPGVPPAIVSGNVAANLLHSKLHPSYPNVHMVAATGITVLSWVVTLLILCAVTARCTCWLDSYVRCIDLMFRHGKTYYAASLLMEWRQFIDTCCLYAVFREADDIVDCFTPEAIKRKEFDEFVRRFWESERSGFVGPDDPLIFHASIPAIRKYAYEKRLWDSFFNSMAKDMSVNVCLSMADTMNYMEGSAAVLGEFMLPLLCPENETSASQRELARPYARDLGLAFQLTNMIRDIGEDIELGRQYIPVETCNKFGVHLSAKDHASPQFHALMEHMLSCTDKFYRSADIGIAMLPIRVRHSIQAARAMYSHIHDSIRTAKYNVFSRRARVSMPMKLKIALQYVQVSQILWMALMDRVTWLALEVYYNSVPALMVIYGLVVSNTLNYSQCSYEEFLAIFVCVPIVALGAYCASFCGKTSFSTIPWALLLCAVATIWTTPWDNYLVYAGIWGYGGADQSRLMLGVLGYVPVAEYMFFSLETILCTLVWLSIFNHREPLQWPPSSRNHTSLRCGGTSVLVLLALIGGIMIHIRRLEYLGLIVVWAVPPLLIQWIFGADALRAHYKPLVTSILFSTVYLSIADQWAIHHGIWNISQRHSLPLAIRDLPLEEVVFFAVTSALVNSGLTLAMLVSKTGFRFKDVMNWGGTAIDDQDRQDQKSETASLRLNITVLATMVIMDAFGLKLAKPLEILIMVLTTVVFGFPHGALDPLLIEQNSSESHTRILRWVQYFSLLGASSMVWMVLPELALFLFLVMTVYHFGEGDVQSNHRFCRWQEIVARGGTFLVTIYSHEQEVANIFTSIVAGSSPEDVAAVISACHVMQLVYVSCTVNLIVHLLFSLKYKSACLLLLEIVTLNLLYYYAPPLLAFAVYFNFYHSQRHVKRVSHMDTWKAKLQLMFKVEVVFTLLATATLVIWIWNSQSSTASMILDARPLLRPTFVIISILTVPHMVLVHQVVSGSKPVQSANDALCDTKIDIAELDVNNAQMITSCNT